MEENHQNNPETKPILPQKIERDIFPDMPRKTITVEGQEYVLIKMPAWNARKYPIEYPKTLAQDDHEKHSKLAMELYQYVAVVVNGVEISLGNEKLINSWIKSADALYEIEAKIFEYNYGFLERGVLLNFLKIVERTLENKFILIAMPFLQKLSKVISQRYKS